jgi:hypothetical protein
MTKWGLAEVHKWSPISGVVPLAQGTKAYYLIYGDGRGQQEIDAKQIEGCIAWFLNNGWEPLQVKSERVGNFDIDTWSFKKKIEESADPAASKLPLATQE